MLIIKSASLIDVNVLSVTSKSIIALIILIHLYYLIIAYRFWCVLNDFGAGINLIRMFIISQQATFYLFTVPTSIGFEVARVVKTFKRSINASKREIFQANIIDRSSGFIASILAFLFSAYFIRNQLNIGSMFDEKMYLIIIAGIIIMLLGVVLVSKINYLNDYVKELLLKWRIVGYATTIALLAQLLYTYVIFISMQSLTHQNISIVTMVLLIAASNLSGIIPLSLFGLSANEMGIAFFAYSIGYDYKTCALLAVLLYGYKLIGAVEGGIFEFVLAIKVFKLRSQSG